MESMNPRFFLAPTPFSFNNPHNKLIMQGCIICCNVPYEVEIECKFHSQMMCASHVSSHLGFLFCRIETIELSRCHNNESSRLRDLSIAVDLITPPHCACEITERESYVVSRGTDLPLLLIRTSIVALVTGLGGEEFDCDLVN